MNRQLRFKNGDRVKVRPEDPGPFAGLEGIIEAMEPNARDVAVLDRYIVVFEWGEKKPFYDAQLVKAGPEEPQS
jgi:hypothetical protein